MDRMEAGLDFCVNDQSPDRDLIPREYQVNGNNFYLTYMEVPRISRQLYKNLTVYTTINQVICPGAAA